MGESIQLNGLTHEIVDSAVEAGGGAVHGAYSVARGTFRAGRQVLRSTGLLGNDEYEDFNFEGKLADEFVSNYVFNRRFRMVVNEGVVQGVKSIEVNPHNTGYVVGRIGVGYLLTPLGFVASTGDLMQAVENGMSTPAEITRMTIYGIK